MEKRLACLASTRKSRYEKVDQFDILLQGCCADIECATCIRSGVDYDLDYSNTNFCKAFKHDVCAVLVKVIFDANKWNIRKLSSLLKIFHKTIKLSGRSNPVCNFVSHI